MANIAFKKGLLANLPSTYAEGTFYVTTDERAIYLDVDSSTRIRLGDFQEFASLDALQANTNPSTTALYYISGLNILAKWNGNEYVQINKDTGATSFEVTGEGNAVTGVSYDATTRKLTLTKGATYMKESDVDSKIAGKVGEIEGTVKAYVDAKTEGIATDAALGELQTRVTTAESEIEALQAANAEGGAVATAIADAKAQADKGVEDASKAQAKADSAYELAESKTTMAEVEAKDYATKAEAQGYANAKDAAIEAAQTAADAAQDDVDALVAKVGEVPEDKTVVQMIADAQAEATYDDTQVKADIKANSDAIDAIEADYLKGSDKTELSEAIAAEKERAEGIESGLETRLAAVEGDYLKQADKDDLQTQINTIMNNPDTEGVINSINEFTKYVEDHGTIADGFRADIDKNKEDIAANTEAIEALGTSVSETYETKTDAADKLTEAKEYADGLDEAMGVRVKALEDIDHDAYVAADEAVLAEANEYADGLNTAMDTRVKVLEAIDHEAYKAYADQAETDAVATAKAYTDELANGQVKTNTEAIATKAAQSDLDSAVERIGTAEGKISALETESAKHALKTEVEAVQGDLDAYKESNNTAVSGKADKATTLAGYGITDAMTAAEIEALVSWGSF